MSEKDEELDFDDIDEVVKEEKTGQEETVEDPKEEKHDVEELFEDKEEKVDKKDKKKNSSKKPAAYKGPKQIRVYGKELFTIPEEEVKDYTDSKIINRIVEEFGFKEFKVNNTELKLDSSNGNVDVKIKFQNKG